MHTREPLQSALAAASVLAFAALLLISARAQASSPAEWDQGSNRTCTDCHDDRPEEDSAHEPLAARGCQNCHVTHDEDSIKSCTDAGCHDGDPTNPASFWGKNHALRSDCEDCHGEAHETVTTPPMNEIAPYCATCHSKEAEEASLAAPSHAALAADGCDNCHVAHAASTAKTCTSAGCHDQDPDNPASLPGLNHVPFQGPTACATCHEGPHAILHPDPSSLATDCTRCHEARARAPGEPHEGVISETECSTCHSKAPGDGGTAGLRGEHGRTDCMTACHRAGNGGGAPVPPYTGSNASEVAWMRANEARFAEWPKEGRGQHVQGAECAECHKPHDAADPLLPASCTTSCHTWLGDVVQRGFPAVWGTPEYRGTIKPQALLQYSKDVDGDGRDHKAIYENFGCTGFCHNRGITVEAAEAWGQQGNAPGLDADTLHGAIRKCTDCHRIESPLGGPADLHTTHIPFIQAEKPAADTRADAPNAACSYCHGSVFPDSQNQYGGCYNCHLSGHRPETFYWEATAPA